MTKFTINPKVVYSGDTCYVTIAAFIVNCKPVLFEDVHFEAIFANKQEVVSRVPSNSG